MLMLMSHCGSLVAYAYAYACVASEDQALESNIRTRFLEIIRSSTQESVPRICFSVQIDSKNYAKR